MSVVLAVVTAAAVLAAGAVASAAVFRPGSISLPTRLASVFGLGYAVAALTPTVLVLAHAFVPAAAAAAARRRRRGPRRGRTPAIPHARAGSAPCGPRWPPSP